MRSTQKLYVLVLLFILDIAQAQTGSITYKITSNFAGQMQAQMETESEQQVARSIEKEMNRYQIRVEFCADRSVSKPIEPLELQGQKLPGFAKSRVRGYSVYFYDRIHKRLVEEKLYRENCTTETITDTQWEIIPDSTKTIAGYPCRLAVASWSFTTRKNGTRTVRVPAWFAPLLPFPYGPLRFVGLPGVVLEVKYNTNVISASEVAIDYDIETDCRIPEPQGDCGEN